MEQFFSLLDQVIIFLIILIIGFASVKAKFLSADALPVLSRFFSRIIVPFILFVNTVGGATRDDIANHFYMIFVNICIFAVLITITRLLPKLLRLKGNKADIFILANTFGNVGFVGIPLLLAVFGQRSMIFVTLYAIVDQFIFWTYGVLLSYPVDNKPKFNIKTLLNMINPPVIAIILAIIIIMLDVKIPEIIIRSCTTMSNTGAALPFIYIGGTVATMNFKKLVKNYEFFVGILIKMVILPICLYMILRAIGLDSEISTSMAVLFGLPALALTPMLASANGSDEEYATAAVIISTVVSLFTLTLVSFVTSFIFK